MPSAADAARFAPSPGRRAKITPSPGTCVKRVSSVREGSPRLAVCCARLVRCRCASAHNGRPACAASAAAPRGVLDARLCPERTGARERPGVAVLFEVLEYGVTAAQRLLPGTGVRPDHGRARHHHLHPPHPAGRAECHQPLARRGPHGHGDGHRYRHGRSDRQRHQDRPAAQSSPWDGPGRGPSGRIPPRRRSHRAHLPRSHGQERSERRAPHGDSAALGRPHPVYLAGRPHGRHGTRHRSTPRTRGVHAAADTGLPASGAR